MQVEVQHVRALHQASIPSLLSDSVKTLCDHIDSFLEATCIQCFGNFTNIHQCLLTLADMRTLIAMANFNPSNMEALHALPWLHSPNET